MNPIARTTFFFVFVIAQSPAPAAPTLTNLGTLPGAEHSWAFAVSHDGLVVVGESGRGVRASRAFRWSQASGMLPLAEPSGTRSSVAYGVSADGEIAVGSCNIGGADRGVRWIGAAVEPLPLALATGISADGRFIAGASLAGTAARWSIAGGVENIGTLPGDRVAEAHAISADGSTLAGYSFGAQRQAFRWTREDGIHALGPNIGTIAQGADWTGSTVVGFSQSGRFVWRRHAGLTFIGPGYAYGVSGDGEVVVGSGIWTAASGTIDIAAFLAALGVDVSGWNNMTATAILPNGSGMVGFGQVGGATRGFLVRGIPCDVVPMIVRDPADTRACPGGSAEFTTDALTYGPASFRWQAVGAAGPFDLADGPLPGSNAVVSGAATPRLVLSGVDGAAGALRFRCMVSNACGDRASSEAGLIYCPADFNCDGRIDFLDYLDFVQAFANEDPSADFNGDGQIDFFDYLDFVQAFAEGCE